MATPPKTTFIYALVDPRSGCARYVGKTGAPKERLLQHLEPNQLRSMSKKNSWLKKLAALNLKPSIVILEEVPYSKWPQQEQYWIEHFRHLISNLTNTVDGGLGGVGSGSSNPFYHKTHAGSTKEHWSKTRQGISKRQKVTSKYVGVSWERSRSKWRATISHKKVCQIIGRFTTEREAAKAYDAAALTLFGQTARTNFNG